MSAPGVKTSIESRLATAADRPPPPSPKLTLSPAKSPDGGGRSPLAERRAERLRREESERREDERDKVAVRQKHDKLFKLTAKQKELEVQRKEKQREADRDLQSWETENAMRRARFDMARAERRGRHGGAERDLTTARLRERLQTGSGSPKGLSPTGSGLLSPRSPVQWMSGESDLANKWERERLMRPQGGPAAASSTGLRWKDMAEGRTWDKPVARSSSSLSGPSPNYRRR